MKLCYVNFCKFCVSYFEIQMWSNLKEEFYKSKTTKSFKTLLRKGIFSPYMK